MPVAGHLLEPVIREHIKELKVVGIKVTHILCPKVKLSAPVKRINPLSPAKICYYCSALWMQVITISIDVAKDVLWSRIQKRLKMEPWRKKYHEVCLSSSGLHALICLIP